MRHVRFEIDTNQDNATSGYVGLAEVQFFAAPSGPDTTEPTISSLNPVNGASDVPTTANLEATFSEPVAFGTGFITIRETAGGTPVASYDVANPPANLTLSGATLTINPTADLAASTGYYVEIDPTAIDDLAGNSFAGCLRPVDVELHDQCARHHGTHHLQPQSGQRGVRRADDGKSRSHLQRTGCLWDRLHHRPEDRRRNARREL